MSNAVPDRLCVATTAEKSAEEPPSSGNVAEAPRIAQSARLFQKSASRAPSVPYEVVETAETELRRALIADKYDLFEQMLGSSLYRCVDVKTEEEFVCKILARDNHSLVSAHYKLDFHPRISSLREVIARNRYLYVVFPKAHGDLHTYVRRKKRLRETEAKRLFRQIVEAVKVCHENAIVLRDLKLRKFVFVDEERTELKLESLEDAVILQHPKFDWLYDKRGCPAYVSPEILNESSYSGKQSDMWSLGVILYALLVGRYPFNSDLNQSNLFEKISTGQFVIPDYLSGRAKCLIRSLMRLVPSERISSEDILCHPWLAKEEKDWSSRACDQMVPDIGFSDD